VSIQARITQIKAQIEETTSDYNREKLQERLAKLAGGVAVLRVGGAAEIEVNRKTRSAASRLCSIISLRGSGATIATASRPCEQTPRHLAKAAGTEADRHRSPMSGSAVHRRWLAVSAHVTR